jgi:FkbM family methyltransferase
MLRRPRPVGADDTSYAVEFDKIRLDGSTHFLPRYAFGRPACRSLRNGELYEPKTHELVAMLLSEFGGDMVHAGTFFGDMLPSFAGHCQGTVYAFEPVLENFVLAKLSVEANGLRNVALFNSALSGSIGTIHIDTGDEAAHLGGASRVADSGQLVSTLTVDSLGLQNVNIIQLDVEGHELSALKGARATLLRCEPVVLIEDNHDECGGWLRGIEYEALGAIPGLSVWSRPNRSKLVQEALGRVGTQASKSS